MSLKKTLSIKSFLVISVLLLFAATLISIRFGANNITYTDIINSILHFDTTNPAHVVIHELRIPRAVAALFVGAALAVSGAIMQGVTRNALASPSILGVTSGSSFFVALAFAFYNEPSYIMIAVHALFGAAIGAAFVFGATAVARGGITPVKLALAGSAITALLSSLSTAIGLKYDISKDISYFYAGGFASIQPIHIKLAVPLIIIGLILAICLAPSISVLSLGEEVAKGLGQRTMLIRVLSSLAVIILTGAAVSIAGMIGFVGLVVPHMVRPIVGVDYRRVLPASAVTGGLLLLLADIAGRTINSPFETPAGAVTALIGVPFFLWLARKDGRGL